MGGWYSMMEVADKNREADGDRDYAHAAREVHPCINEQVHASQLLRGTLTKI